MTHEGSSDWFISVSMSDIVSLLYITSKLNLDQLFTLNKKIQAELFELKTKLRKSHDFQRKAIFLSFRAFRVFWSFWHENSTVEN